MRGQLGERLAGKRRTPREHLIRQHTQRIHIACDGGKLAAQQLKNCTEARTYLSLVKQKYPKSNVTKQVDELDKAIKKDLKNKAKTDYKFSNN